MDRKVKGAFLADFARMIKARKDLDWSQYLQPQDLRFLQDKILPREWYPFDTFERMGSAIVKEIAHGNMEIVRMWGRISVEALKALHQDMVVAGNPYESLIRFQVVRKDFFSFNPVNITVFFQNYAKVESAYQMSALAEESAVYQSLGYLERLLELSGANNVQHKFLRKMWEGSPSTVMELSWSNVTPEMKVRGILFQDYVRMIKNFKDADWNRYLLPRDLPFLGEKIGQTEWYPLESFERMGIGILNEIADGSTEAARFFGQSDVETQVQTNPGLVCPGDPLESLLRFQVLRSSFFNFNAINVESVHGNFAKLRIEYRMCRLAEEAATYQALGFFEKLLKLAGAKNVDYQFTSKSWEGDPTTILELKWL